MDTLTDRLEQLADDAPATLSADDLWQRGRRLTWRRRSVAAVAACVVVAGTATAGLMVTEQARESFTPADSVAELPLPDRVQSPGAWTEGTDDGGPIGPLSAILGAERRHLWSERENGIAGISATGEYRFLDLPRISSADATAAIALSPDGRLLAYPIADPAPRTLVPGVVAGAGVGVLDTVTGDVRTWEVGSLFGIDVYHLAWSGPATLLIDYGRYEDPSITAGGLGSTGEPFLTWDVEVTDEPVEARFDAPPLSDAVSTSDGLVTSNGRRVRTVTPDGSLSDLVRLPSLAEGRVAVSPDGTRVAYLRDVDGASTTSNDSKPLTVVSLGDPAAAGMPDAPRAHELIGWRDDTHVVVLDYLDLVYRSVDVTTGATTDLLSLDAQSYGIGLVVAGDAIRGPVFDAPAPDRANDPRVVGGIALTVVLLALFLGYGRWRRVRG